LVGNKSDLESKRIVKVPEVEELCKKKKLKHFLVSAKNGQNVNALFKDLAERLAKKYLKTEKSIKKTGLIIGS